MAFIAGNIALLITMALHPSGAQLAGAGSRFDVMVLLNTFVHTLAIFAIPLLFLGGLALTSMAVGRRSLAISALIFYAFALCAGMCAGVMSGYIAPDMLRRMAQAGDPQSQQVWRLLFRYTGQLNQAFARVLVVGSATAIILWSCAMPSRAMRWYGILSNAAIALVVMVGLLPLDVHGYGLVVLLQGVWFVATGVKMWRGTLEFNRAPASSWPESR